MVGLNPADDQQPFPRQMKILFKLFSLILITLRPQSTKMTPPFKVHTLLIADSVPILPNAIKLEVTYFRYPQPNNTKNKNKKNTSTKWKFEISLNIYYFQKPYDLYFYTCLNKNSLKSYIKTQIFV